jgi:penicillin-binding protein 1A
VWLGNDDNSPMARVTGGDVPAKLWAWLMLD